MSKITCESCRFKAEELASVRAYNSIEYLMVDALYESVLKLREAVYRAEYDKRRPR